MPVIVFIVAVLSGLLAVAAGVAVFRVDSMARATFALLASFVFAAVPLLAVGLAYLGVLLILMMTMEMMVMLVFMLMFMMNPAGLMPMKMVHNQRGSLLAAGISFVLLAAGALLTPWPARSPAPQADPAQADPTRLLGLDVMGPHMLVMILVGLVLFAAIVGAVALTMPRGRYDRYGDRLDRRPPTDPIRGGVGR